MGEAGKIYQEANKFAGIAEKLGEAREIAQETGGRLLLYFIDMAIYEACESICAISRPSVAKHLEQRCNKFVVAR
jgi:hypothetical protein